MMENVHHSVHFLKTTHFLHNLSENESYISTQLLVLDLARLGQCKGPSSSYGIYFLHSFCPTNMKRCLRQANHTALKPLSAAAIKWLWGRQLYPCFPRTRKAIYLLWVGNERHLSRNSVILVFFPKSNQRGAQSSVSQKISEKQIKTEEWFKT